MGIPELKEYNMIVNQKKPEKKANQTGAPIDYEDPGQVRDLMATGTRKRYIRQPLNLTPTLSRL